MPSHTAPRPDPLAVPLRQAPAVTGLSLSTIYRLASDGRLTLLKSGRSTLLCMASARAYLAALPQLPARSRGDA
jgi:excisionase family DNA binding protein